MQDAQGRRKFLLQKRNDDLKVDKDDFVKFHETLSFQERIAF